MYELNKFADHEKDKTNVEALVTARLIQLTYNMNRGESQTPIEDVSGYLPFPHRYQALSQEALVEHISKQAALDFARYYSELDNNTKLAFDSIKVGLFNKAKK